jgi:hypothetical protein
MELDAPAEYRDLETTDGSYHSVSSVAVVALVVGVLSPLAFAHVLLWSLPLVGVAVSLAALVQIDRSDGVLIGRKAAVVGLVLSLIAGLGAIVHVTTRSSWLESRAELVADRFLELLRDGKTYEAHQLWTQPQIRFPDDSDLRALYAETPEATRGYEAFLKTAVVKEILGLKDRAQLDHESTHLTYTEVELEGAKTVHDYFMVFYRLRGPSDVGAIDKNIKIVVERTAEPETGEQWRVVSAEEVEQ